MKPAIPLTDPRFDYVSAVSTNLHARFAKIRLEQSIAAHAAGVGRQAILAQAAADVQAIADIFAARRDVIDLERERKFRAFVDVSAGKK